MASPYAGVPPPYNTLNHPGMPIATAPVPGAFPMPQPGGPLPPAGWQPSSMTCPPGLEYLMALDYIFVSQKLELLEAFIGWETKNKYAVINVQGEQIYFVGEDSNICSRLCMGRYRPCEFQVYDSSRREVLRMVRPLRCDWQCCPCCLQELEVYSGDILLGSVVQDWSLWRPYFSIRDATGKTVLTIKGPCIRFCVTVGFQVRSADDRHRVGSIKKKWSGVVREAFTDSDMFGVNFPVDLDVKMKAVLLGACLLIDFMYFEKS